MQPAHGLGEPLCAIEYISQLFFQQLRVQELLAVFPLVECFALVQPLIALQSHQRPVNDHRTGLGQFGFPHAGRTLDQYRFFERGGQPNNGGDARRADIARRLESLLDCINIAQSGVVGIRQGILSI